MVAKYIDSMDDDAYHHRGIAKVEDNIYVLDYTPNRIRVYENQIDFRFIRDITLSGTHYPNDIIYSDKSKNVYISDSEDKCVWVMTTTEEHRLTKWLNNVTFPNTLSLSNEGHLLVLRHGESDVPNQLEIYSLEATLIRALHLPKNVADPLHVVQMSTGEFIVSHRLEGTLTGTLSQLTNNGQLIRQIVPRNKSEELGYPGHLALDSDNNRLFVADYTRDQVILFDSNDLTWSQVVVSKEKNGIRDPNRLFYDTRKKQLFVTQSLFNVTVYEIN